MEKAPVDRTMAAARSSVGSARAETRQHPSHHADGTTGRVRAIHFAAASTHDRRHPVARDVRSADRLRPERPSIRCFGWPWKADETRDALPRRRGSIQRNEDDRSAGHGALPPTARCRIDRTTDRQTESRRRRGHAARSPRPPMDAPARPTTGPMAVAPDNPSPVTVQRPPLTARPRRSPAAGTPFTKGATVPTTPQASDHSAAPAPQPDVWQT